MLKSDQLWANATVDRGNAIIKKNAQSMGATFVDIASKGVPGSFYGHSSCDPEPFINRAWLGTNGIDNHWPGASPESFHPNPDGQEAIADALRHAYATTSVPESSQPTPPPTTSPTPPPVTPPDASGPLAVVSRPETATAGTPFTFTYRAEGGTPPYRWEANRGRPMPPGLTLSSDGHVTGTPVISGTHHTAVMVTDVTGEARISPGWIVVGLSSPQKELVMVNTNGGDINFEGPHCGNYTPTRQLNAAGGTGPYTWSRGATWPAGLDIAADGLVTGDYYRNPADEGADVVVTDAAGATQQAQFRIGWVHSCA